MKEILNNGNGTQSVVALEDGNLITGFVQDCTPIVEDAKARHNAGLFGSSEMKHAARLPQWAVEAYCHANDITLHEWMSNPVHIKRMLSDPALSDFRIWKGAV